MIVNFTKVMQAILVSLTIIEEGSMSECMWKFYYEK